MLRRLDEVISLQKLGCAGSPTAANWTQEPRAGYSFQVDALLHVDASWLHPRDLARAGAVNKLFAGHFGRKSVWKNLVKKGFPEEANALMNDRRARKCDYFEHGGHWKLWFGDLVGRKRNQSAWLFAGCRGVVLQEFSSWVGDIPFALCTLVALLSPYRAFPLVRDLYRSPDPSTARAVCLASLEMAILDFLQVLFPLQRWNFFLTRAIFVASGDCRIIHNRIQTSNHSVEAQGSPISSIFFNSK